LAAVQIHFAGGRRRDYLIFHRPDVANAAGRTAGSWWVRSLACVPGLADLDLRRRQDALEAEAGLAKLDLAWLSQQLGGE
jgi:hypothetical protein